MLDKIAFQLLSQNQYLVQVIFFCFPIVGGIIAALVTQSEMQISRAPYFARVALIFLMVSAAQLVLLQPLSAMEGGYFWVLMMISIGAFTAGGFFLCRIAMARSRDVCGHGRMAFLAFIPIANLWLIAKPSKEGGSANRVQTTPILSGGTGVLIGIALFAAAAGVNIYMSIQVREMERRATEPMTQQAVIDSLIRSNSLEGVLKLLTAKSQTPIAVDDVTTLVRIESSGMQLQRTFVVDLEGIVMTNEDRQRIRNDTCAQLSLVPLLRAGAVIREVYVEQSGREIGAVVVTRQECGL